MSLEAPMTGAAAAPATPSNFSDTMAARSESASNTGGLFQPDAGQSSTGQRGARPSDMGRTGNTDSGVDGSWDAPSQNESGDSQEQTQDDQPYEVEAEVVHEPEYDEFGNEVDNEEIQAQRAQAISEIQEALNKGEFPYEQLKDIPVDVKVNGETRQVPFSEMRDGYMRQQHFTRALGEAQAIANRAEHILGLERGRNQEWRDPNAMMRDIQQMGLQPSFEAAAMQWARQKVDYMSKSPLERQIIDQQRQLQAREQNLVRQHQEYERQLQQNRGPDPATVHATRQIEQLMPRALKGQGVGVYPYSQQQFVQNLQILCMEDGQITPQRARDAAIATREHLEDIARLQGQNPQSRLQRRQESGGEQEPTSPARFPINPRRLGSGPPRQSQTLMLGSQGSSQNRQSKGVSQSSSGQKGLRPSEIAGRLGFG